MSDVFVFNNNIITIRFNLRMNKGGFRVIDYMRVGVILLILGILGGVLNRKNLIIMLMSIELMLLAVSFLFLKISLGK